MIAQKQDALAHLSTVRDWIRFGVSWLTQSGAVYGQGTNNAWDESVYLVLGTLALPIDQLEPYLDAHLLPAERLHLFEALQRRCDQHEPSAYILGKAWLQGYRFRVSRDVIIPRSPIAELLVERLEPWLTSEPKRVLDVCTGSGCLAILAALEFEDAQIVATDLSAAALKVATQNVADYGLQDRITLVQTNLIDGLDTQPPFDLLICNPPYVNADSMAALPAEYRHEPQMALAGGDKGMDLVASLLEQAGAYMDPDGWVLLEIGHEQAHFEETFPDLSPIWLQTATTDNQIMLIAARDLPHPN